MSLANARQLGELGRRFMDRSQPSLEAQLTNLADEIAYNNHDIDDGLRSGLLTMQQMEAVLWGTTVCFVTLYPQRATDHLGLLMGVGGEGMCLL